MIFFDYLLEVWVEGSGMWFVGEEFVFLWFSLIFVGVFFV